MMCTCSIVHYKNIYITINGILAWDVQVLDFNWHWTVQLAGNSMLPVGPTVWDRVVLVTGPLLVDWRPGARAASHNSKLLIADAQTAMENDLAKIQDYYRIATILVIRRSG